jgi:thiol-disulfide isomerase/thioredoxin
MRIFVISLLLTLLSACGSETSVATHSSLDELKGQWVFVNYWAQWCKPCIEEIPELNHLDNARKDVAVLGVNYEGATGDALKEQEEKLGVAFATIADPSAELGIPRPVVLPTTLLINPDGEFVEKLLGPQTKETLESAIRIAQEASEHSSTVK